MLISCGRGVEDPLSALLSAFIGCVNGTIIFNATVGVGNVANGVVNGAALVKCECIFRSGVVSTATFIADSLALVLRERMGLILRLCMGLIDSESVTLLDSSC